MVDKTALGEGRDDDRRDTIARAKAVAPARSARRRRMVPKAAVFIIGDDDQHPVPLRALFEALQQIGDMRVAAQDSAGVRMLAQPSNGLVEGDGGKRALVDVALELIAVFEVLGAIGGAGRKPREIIERL